MVVDSSVSVQESGFDIQQKFLTELVGKLPVNPDGIQFGLVRFAQRAEKMFDLNTYDNAKAVQDGILKMRRVTGLTNTHLGLSMARSMFTPELGARNQTKKVVIVLTDGESTTANKTMTAAQQLKDTGVSVVAIGVGAKVSEKELTAMASGSEYVLQPDSVEKLLKNDFLDKKVLASVQCITSKHLFKINSFSNVITKSIIDGSLLFQTSFSHDLVTELFSRTGF